MKDFSRIVPAPLSTAWPAFLILFAGVAMGWWLDSSTAGAGLISVSLVIMTCGIALMFIRQKRTSSAMFRLNERLTEQIDAQTLLQNKLKLYASVFTNTREGMLITDIQGRILAINPAFTAITGFTSEETLGARPSILSSGQQSPEFYQDMWRVLAAEDEWQGEIWNRRRNGNIFPEWLTVNAVRDEHNEITHYIGIFTDISEHKDTEAHIHHLSYHDPLTGLPNRAQLNSRLEHAIEKAKQTQQQGAVLLLDLDRFKLINETIDHATGDELLRLVAKRSLSVLRKTDTLGRQGGDEFVIILPDTSEAQAACIARKLLLAISQPCQLAEHELSVTCSIGIAVFPRDGDNSDGLLRSADAAMSLAKQEGRNDFQFYTADLNSARLDDLLLEHQLRSAIVRNELVLHYQAKVDASGRLRGCEALIRWQHPELGLLGPDRFIPVAEASGLILPIGEWVIQQACEQLRDWLDQGLVPVPVAVNLAAQQLNEHTVEQIRNCLSQLDLQPELLALELTETMLMRDIHRALTIISELKDMGVSLAIDDFGTGYSSLTYLRQLQVDTLKIDRSFVNGIGSTADDGTIAVAVIALAHSMGLEVVAEGVETDHQQAFLIRHGCDYLQGFLFGRPEPLNVFSARLSHQT